MRLIGWCLRCHKVKRVDVATSVCDDCEEQA